MTTIRDAIKLKNYVDDVIGFFGVSADFIRELDQRFHQLADAIAKEHGFANRSEAAKLPRETPLGPDSQTAFDELKGWLRQNGRQHFEDI